jgi:hypothetical protein
MCIVVLSGPLSAQPTEAPTQQPIQIPMGAPTIPNDLMYSLGQQSSQLANITARLEKMDSRITENQSDTSDRMEILQGDVTKLNVYASIAGLFIGGPLMVVFGNWLNEKRKSFFDKKAASGSEG